MSNTTTYSFGSVLANVNVDGFSTSNPDALNALVTLPNVIRRQSRTSGSSRASDQVRVETSTLPWGQREVSVRFEDQAHSMTIDPWMTAGLTDEDARARLQAASDALSRRVLERTQERIENQIMSAVLSSSSERSPRIPSYNPYTEQEEIRTEQEGLFGRQPVVTSNNAEYNAALVAAQNTEIYGQSEVLRQFRILLAARAAAQVAQPTIPIPAAKAEPAPAKPAAPRRSVGRGRMPVLIEDGECEQP